MGVEILSTPWGDVAFGFTRGGDERGHYCVKVKLPQKPWLYGEWRALFAENDNDFDVEVLSFGFTDIRNVGNPHPSARVSLSVDEQGAVRRCVEALVTDSRSTEGIVPFSSSKGRFLSRVQFSPYWTLCG